MASGYGAYQLDLAAGKSYTLDCYCQLQCNGPLIIPGQAIEKIKSDWNQILSGGVNISTPDLRINNLLHAAISSLMLLTDQTSITPGPATYHQFWFRDATYMLLALDRFGFTKYSSPIIEAMPSRQKRSGFFKSQQGEWDSNGQVLWTVRHHALVPGENGRIAIPFDKLLKAVGWLWKARHIGKKTAGNKFFYGLLPAGLSAEHLGLIDHYYWDNFWSLAGIESFAAICRSLGKSRELVQTLGFSKEYRNDLEKSLDQVQERLGIQAIPAAPGRGIDHGMIGSICAWYPLQILPREDPRLCATLQVLMERFMYRGMFYQQFIHSGLNPYLTLQIAHAWLYAGERTTFWNMLTTVMDHVSPTLNFPEAIHPQTKGGCVGDGHHGWASAEILLALRDAFVYEYWNVENDRYDLMLLSGIPRGWFDAGRQFYIHNVLFPGGKLDLNVTTDSVSVTVKIFFQREGSLQAEQWKIKVPFPTGGLQINGNRLNQSFSAEQEILLPVPEKSGHLEIVFFCVNKD
jgi:hypothetical protein